MEDVEQQHIEGMLHGATWSAWPSVLGEDDRVPFLFEAAAEEESIHPVVVCDEDRARRDESTHIGAFCAHRLERPFEPALLLLDPRRGGRAPPRADRPSPAARAMRQSSANSVAPSVAPFDFSVCAARRTSAASPASRAWRSVARSVGDVREERVDHLGEEVVASELAQALQRGAVEV